MKAKFNGLVQLPACKRNRPTSSESARGQIRGLEQNFQKLNVNWYPTLPPILHASSIFRAFWHGWLPGTQTKQVVAAPKFPAVWSIVQDENLDKFTSNVNRTDISLT